MGRLYLALTELSKVVKASCQYDKMAFRWVGTDLQPGIVGSQAQLYNH